jgi:ubiquinone/menaquinone biosynthesis C-methylase UbiE
MSSIEPAPSTRAPTSPAALDGADQVCAYFERQAGRYGAFYDHRTRTGSACLFQLRAAIAGELSRGGPNGPMLDLATGTGEITRRIASEAGATELDLNDFSPAMSQQCRAVFAPDAARFSIRWSCRDAFALLADAPSEHYGMILCLGLIAHTGRLDELLALCARVLRPSGALLLQSSLEDHPGVRLVGAYASSPLRRTRHKHARFRLGELRRAAMNAGFEIVAERRFGVCVPFGDRLLGRLNHLIESRYAERMTWWGGEVVLKLRRRG